MQCDAEVRSENGEALRQAALGLSAFLGSPSSVQRRSAQEFRHEATILFLQDGWVGVSQGSALHSGRNYLLRLLTDRRITVYRPGF